MRAKVIKQFEGVLDGTVLPVTIKEGEFVTGDLAVVAVKQQWATEVPDEPVAVEAKAAPARQVGRAPARAGGK